MHALAFEAFKYGRNGRPLSIPLDELQLYTLFSHREALVLKVQKEVFEHCAYQMQDALAAAQGEIQGLKRQMADDAKMVRTETNRALTILLKVKKTHESPPSDA